MSTDQTGKPMQAPLTLACRYLLTCRSSAPCIALLLMALGSTGPVYAQHPLDNARIAGSTLVEYQVRSNQFPYRLEGRLRWQRDMSRYQAQLEYSLLGRRRSQSSEGRIGALALMPERFVDHKGKDLTVLFAQAGGQATLPNGEQVSLQAGAQDRLSIILNLSALVASHPQAFSPGHRLTQQAVGAGGVTVWTWTLRGIEELTLPGGTLTAQRWVREVRESGDQGLEVWISQALGYLPARIRITKSNGDQIDQQWHRHQALANP